MFIGDGLTGVAGSRGVKRATCEITDTSGVYPICLVDLEVFYLGHLKNFYTIQCTSYNWHINLTPALIDKCTADVNTIAKILQCCVPRNTSSEQSVDYKQRSKTVYFAMSKHQKQSKKKFTVVTGSWFDSVSGCCLSSLI